MVRDYTNGITSIDANLKRHGLASIHLLRVGDRYALIDTGTTYSVPYVLETLANKNIDVNQIDYVMLTHVHLDHAGGAGSFMQKFPNAKLVVHNRGFRHMVDPSILIKGATEVYGESEMQETYGEILPIPAERIIQTTDNFELNFNGRLIKFLDTQGHCKHHHCIYDTELNVFFTGDSFGIAYPEFVIDGKAFVYPTSSPTQFDPAEAHKTIDRLMSYNPEAMYLTHYSEIKFLDQVAVELHEQLDEYVVLAKNLLENNNLSAEEKQSAVYNGLFENCLKRIREHGCHLEAEKVKEVLDLDLDLNAQGLIYWFENKKS